MPSARACGREPYIGQAQGQELLHKTYTIAGQSDSLRVTLESQFSIASVSKRLIRYGVLLLAQQGRLSLQDPISRFLPDFPRGQDITVAQLLSHQSGLPRELTNDRQLEQVSLVRTIELARQLAHGLPQRRNAVLLLLPRKPNATPAGRWGGGAQWWQKADGLRKNSRT